MRVLVTGGTGRLGVEVRKLRPDWAYPGHQDLDITSFTSIRYYYQGLPRDSRHYEAVLHLAAKTDVPWCETHRKEAWDINVGGTLNLVRMEYPFGIRFFYMSTPCVFPGTKGPYSEEDIPSPVNFYGLTKAVSEGVVRGAFYSSYVLRGNFVPRGPWPFGGAFNDRWGTYLYADTLASEIVKMVESEDYLPGIWHIPGDRKMSMFELAKITTLSVRPIYLEDYPGPVHLTKDMTLTSIKRDPVHFE